MTKPMTHSEALKRLQEAFASIGIVVNEDKITPEEAQRTYFVFPPKVRPSAAIPSNTPTNPSNQESTPQ
jgi:hypothetical protein